MAFAGDSCRFATTVDCQALKVDNGFFVNGKIDTAVQNEAICGEKRGIASL